MQIHLLGSHPDLSVACLVPGTWRTLVTVVSVAVPHPLVKLTNRPTHIGQLTYTIASLPGFESTAASHPRERR